MSSTPNWAWPSHAGPTGSTDGRGGGCHDVLGDCASAGRRDARPGSGAGAAPVGEPAGAQGLGAPRRRGESPRGVLELRVALRRGRRAAVSLASASGRLRVAVGTTGASQQPNGLVADPALAWNRAGRARRRRSSRADPSAARSRARRTAPVRPKGPARARCLVGDRNPRPRRPEPRDHSFRGFSRLFPHLPRGLRDRAAARAVSPRLPSRLSRPASAGARVPRAPRGDSPFAGCAGAGGGGVGSHGSSLRVAQSVGSIASGRAHRLRQSGVPLHSVVVSGRNPHDPAPDGRLPERGRAGRRRIVAGVVRPARPLRRGRSSGAERPRAADASLRRGTLAPRPRRAGSAALRRVLGLGRPAARAVLHRDRRPGRRRDRLALRILVFLRSCAPPPVRPRTNDPASSGSAGSRVGFARPRDRPPPDARPDAVPAVRIRPCSVPANGHPGASRMDQIARGIDMETRRMELRGIVRVAGEVIAQYWPMRTFVHHNPLHSLEYLPFDEAVARGAQFLGGRGYLAGDLYRRYLRAGRIHLHHLEEALRPLARDQHVIVGPCRIAHREVLRACLTHGLCAPPDEPLDALVDGGPNEDLVRALADHLAPVVSAPTVYAQITAAVKDDLSSLGRALTLSSWCDRTCGTSIVAQVNSEMVKWCEAFLDEGHAAWSMPGRERGFYLAWKSLAAREWSPCGIADSRRKIASLPEHPEDAVLESLDILAIPHELRQDYLSLQLTALPG